MQIFSSLSHLRSSDYPNFVISVIKSTGLTHPVGFHAIMLCLDDKLAIHVACGTEGECAD